MLLQYVELQNTYAEIAAHELFWVPELSGKALPAGEAGCEGMGSNDQTSAEEPPQRCCRYRVTSSSLQAVPWVQVRPWR